ncbi:MAG: hypothetical protein HQL54_05570 [Magnetococcales bacterium]|nr:hypothetical protein [Magnetococcales bacterium]
MISRLVTALTTALFISLISLSVQAGGFLFHDTKSPPKVQTIPPMAVTPTLVAPQAPMILYPTIQQTAVPMIITPSAPIVAAPTVPQAYVSTPHPSYPHSIALHPYAVAPQPYVMAPLPMMAPAPTFIPAQPAKPLEMHSYPGVPGRYFEVE